MSYWDVSTILSILDRLLLREDVRFKLFEGTLHGASRGICMASANTLLSVSKDLIAYFSLDAKVKQKRGHGMAKGMGSHERGESCFLANANDDLWFRGGAVVSRVST